MTTCSMFADWEAIAGVNYIFDLLWAQLTRSQKIWLVAISSPDFP